MEMNYRNKFLFVLIVAIAISPLISWVGSNENIERLKVYGQEANSSSTQQIEDENQTIGILMKYKNEFYCYDESTTTQKDVIESIESESMDVEMYLHNKALSAAANSDDSDEDFGYQSALKDCKDMISKGIISIEDYKSNSIK